MSRDSSCSNDDYYHLLRDFVDHVRTRRLLRQEEDVVFDCVEEVDRLRQTDANLRAAAGGSHGKDHPIDDITITLCKGIERLEEKKRLLLSSDEERQRKWVELECVSSLAPLCGGQLVAPVVEPSSMDRHESNSVTMPHHAEDWTRMRLTMAHHLEEKRQELQEATEAFHQLICEKNQMLQSCRKEIDEVQRALQKEKRNGRLSLEEIGKTIAPLQSALATCVSGMNRQSNVNFASVSVKPYLWNELQLLLANAEKELLASPSTQRRGDLVAVAHCLESGRRLYNSAQ
ncbi:hypothetical protein ADEAN_000651700 [Angomonas deanei]|uniref:Uncharacterized protein n=1 Tax=Angomonas deanei TaxID=59799 RepID=A0A7G2CJA7_9TRYP|nr:hypothetical protein ADEAN_000651700 [Angomonas deanei]